MDITEQGIRPVPARQRILAVAIVERVVAGPATTTVAVSGNVHLEPGAELTSHPSRS